MTNTEFKQVSRTERAEQSYRRERDVPYGRAAGGDVAVSTRIRLARNFEDYPFPNRLTDVSLAQEIVQLVTDELCGVEDFTLRRMNNLSAEEASSLRESNLISQDLIKNRAISAVLISSDESISVMINEEDHIREQYFMKGFDLEAAYERLAGIDDIIASAIPFAYDKQFGYLTACPTNLGTGLRASVMLFLPAMARSGLMRTFAEELAREGLTVRGAYGEGSGAEGALYQISNERTLGRSEEEILRAVDSAVGRIIETEHAERRRILKEDRIGIADVVLRSLGILTNCVRLNMREFMRYMQNVKFGVVLGLLDGNIEELDGLIVDMRPSNIDQINGSPLEEGGYDTFRAAYVGDVLRRMGLISEEARARLSGTD